MNTKNNDIEIINNLFDLVRDQGSRENWENKYELFALRAKRRRRRIQAYGSAGTAVVFLVIASVYISMTKNTEPDQLFDTYYSKHEFSYDYRTESKVTSLFAVALEEYNEGNPGNSIDILDSLIIQNPADPDYQFLYALNLMEQYQFSEAAMFLDQIISTGGSYEIVGLWYKGLCFLKLDDISQAKQQFKQLEELDDPIYSNKAKRIFRKL